MRHEIGLPPPITGVDVVMVPDSALDRGDEVGTLRAMRSIRAALDDDGWAIATDVELPAAVRAMFDVQPAPGGAVLLRPRHAIETVTEEGSILARTVQRCSPPSLLCDPDLQVVHIAPQAEPYLVRKAHGESDLLTMIHPGLLLELEAAIIAARRGTGRKRRGTVVDVGGRRRLVEMQVDLVDYPAPSGGLLVQFFAYDDPPQGHDDEPVPPLDSAPDHHRRFVEVGQVLAIALDDARDVVFDRRAELVVDPRSSAAVVHVDVRRVTRAFVWLFATLAPRTAPRGVLRVVSRAAFDTVTVWARVDDASSRDLRNYGSHSSIAQQILELQGARVTWRRDDVVVQLPVARVGRPRAIGLQPSSEPSQRVLIVDRDPSSATMIRDQVRVCGYEARIVFDDTSALAAIALFDPHVVLVEIDMAVTSQVLATRSPKRRRTDRPRRIIAMVPAGDVARHNVAHFDAFIERPATLGALSRKLAAPTRAGVPRA